MPSNDLAEELLENSPRGDSESPKSHQFLRHWKLGLATALFLWSVFELFSGTITQDLSRPAKTIAILLFSLPGIVFVFLWATERFGISSSLINAPEVDRILMGHAGRLGRAADARQILSLLSQYSMIHLTGESGVGKTTFVRYGMSEAIEAAGEASVIIIDSLGEEFGESEDGALRAALKRKFGDRIHMNSRAHALTLLESVLDHPTILVFDEFNAYLAQNRSNLLDAEQGIWKAPELICESNRFWKRLFELNRKENLKLVLVVRSDESDGLSSFSTNRFTTKPLARLELGMFHSIFDEIGNQCVKNRAATYDRLVEVLIEDLSQNRGYILPVEAALAIGSLKTQRDLSVGSYVRAGGLNGLIGRRLVNDIDKARSGLFTHDEAMKILEQLFTTPDGAMDVTSQEIQSRLHKRSGVELSLDRIEFFLNLLSKENIVRKTYRQGRQTEEVDGSLVAWRFYHSYVSSGIAALIKKESSFEQRIGQLIGEYGKTRGFLRWKSLAPPLLWLHISTLWILGRLKVPGVGRYVAHSSLRLVPWLALPLTFVLASDLGMDYPGSKRIRWRIDQLGVSLFRRPDVQLVTQVANQLSDECTTFVCSRFDGPGVVGHVSQERQILDCWTTFQAAACVASRADLPTGTVEELCEMYKHAFNQDFAIEVAGQFRGWSQFAYESPDEKQRQFKETESMPRAEITCWALIAAARLTPHLPADKREAISRHAQRVGAALSRHYQGNGAWTRYDDQVIKNDYSVYVSCLALLALVECREAGLDVVVGPETHEELIAKTRQWLLGARSSKDGFLGWNDQVGSDSNHSIALTLNVYAVILKSGYPEAAVCEDAFNVIEICWENGFEIQEISKRPQMFVNPWGHLKGAEYPLTFLTYPWLVECTCELLEQRTTLTAAQRRILESFLTELVVSQGRENLAQLTGKDLLTYRVAEFLYCIQSPMELPDKPLP